MLQSFRSTYRNHGQGAKNLYTKRCFFINENPNMVIGKESMLAVFSLHAYSAFGSIFVDGDWLIEASWTHKSFSVDIDKDLCDRGWHGFSPSKHRPCFRDDVKRGTTAHVVRHTVSSPRHRFAQEHGASCSQNKATRKRWWRVGGSQHLLSPLRPAGSCCAGHGYLGSAFRRALLGTTPQQLVRQRSSRAHTGRRRVDDRAAFRHCARIAYKIPSQVAGAFYMSLHPWHVVR
jgi:hypothetical protein